jgi:hypothetical protein
MSPNPTKNTGKGSGKEKGRNKSGAGPLPVLPTIPVAEITLPVTEAGLVRLIQTLAANNIMSKQSFDQLCNRMSYSYYRFAKEGLAKKSKAAGGGKEPSKKEQKPKDRKTGHAESGLMKFLGTVPMGLVMWKSKVPELGTKHNKIVEELQDGSQLLIHEYAMEKLLNNEVNKANCRHALEELGLSQDEVATSSLWFPYLGLSKAKVLAAKEALKESSDSRE